MTIKELLDVIDINREYDGEYLEIENENGEVNARFTTGSEVAKLVEDWEVSGIQARERGVIRVWIKRG